MFSCLPNLSSHPKGALCPPLNRRFSGENAVVRCSQMLGVSSRLREGSKVWLLRIKGNRLCWDIILVRMFQGLLYQMVLDCLPSTESFSDIPLPAVILSKHVLFQRNLLLGLASASLSVGLHCSR